MLYVFWFFVFHNLATVTRKNENVKAGLQTESMGSKMLEMMVT